MKKNNEAMSVSPLRSYVAPRIEVYEVELESGVATESTQVTPGDGSGSIPVEGWDPGGDIGGEIPW